MTTRVASQLRADDLSRHAAFLNRLARALARGRDEADDLVQDAYLTALRHPPDPDRPARPWLAEVVRNLVRMRRRGEARGRERERAWAVEERAVPSPDELLERALAHRALAEEVVLLAEPFRRTLLLRYVEGLETARIAELEGVAPGTVRWRVKEGLDRLRAGLDTREEPNQRGRWMRALAPLAAPLGPPLAAPLGPSLAAANMHWVARGALIMKMKSKLALLLVALAVLGGAVAVLVQLRGEERTSASAAGMSARPAAPKRLSGPESQPAARALDRRPLALVAARAEADPALERGSIEGRVMSWSSAEAVPGAEVLMSLADGSSTTLVTDADGRFGFEPARAGRVAIAAITAPGYLPFAPEWGYSPIELMARPGVRVRDVVVYLSPAFDYTGLVLAPDGSPVAGAEIRIIDLPAREQELVSIPDRFTSDSKGTFTFQAPDAALFEARAAGYGIARARLDQAAQITRRLVLRLPPAGPAADRLGSARLRGVVVDGTGAPLDGVLVSAAPNLAKPMPGRARHVDDDLASAGRAITGDDGRFAVAGLDPGDYEVVARDRVHTPARAQVTLTRGGEVEVRLAMASGALLIGRVLDHVGEPVPAFTVVVFESRGLTRELIATRTFIDSEGKFAIEGLEARSYRVLATAHGHAPAQSVDATAVLPPAEPSPVDIRLHSGATLIGSVRSSAGKALEGARLSVEGGLGEGSTPVPFFASAVTDAGGQFALRGLAPGRRSVVVLASGHHGKILTGLDISEGAQIGPIEVVLDPIADGEKPTVELAGIGAALAGVDDALEVKQVMPGGGAEAAGLVAGDRILSIDGRAVLDLGFEPAIQAIRGPVGTTVRLSVRRLANPGTIVEIAAPRVKIRF